MRAALLAARAAGTQSAFDEALEVIRWELEAEIGSLFLANKIIGALQADPEFQAIMRTWLGGAGR